tara:strand:+ start:99 stop:248 length:150 start_codon:yes stop_codon:yes gene_type:complete
MTPIGIPSPLVLPSEDFQTKYTFFDLKIIFLNASFFKNNERNNIGIEIK